MRIGYARVSTEQQVLARQLDQLQAYGCDVIYQEKMTGTKKDRPELANVIVQAREGDQVVIESLSRLGLSAKELGVAVSTINRWEKGKSKPNIAAMKSIRQFCSINGFSYEEVEIKWLGADEVDVR